MTTTKPHEKNIDLLSFSYNKTSCVCVCLSRLSRSFRLGRCGGIHRIRNHSGNTHDRFPRIHTRFYKCFVLLFVCYTLICSVYTRWWLIFHVRLCLALFAVHGANPEANKTELNNNTAEQRMV